MRRITFAFSLLTVLLAGCEENGPTIKDPLPFYGCYKLGKMRVVIQKNYVTIPLAGANTRIKRFLALKDHYAVNVVNNIVADRKAGSLTIGHGDTGFFYNFDDSKPIKALMLPDESGDITRLPKINCS